MAASKGDIDPPKEGEPILPWARQVTAVVKSLFPKASKDLMPFHGPGGFGFHLRGPRRLPSVAEVPFTVRLAGDRIIVTPGDINNAQPTTVDGEEDWQFAAAVGVVFLKVIFNAASGDMTARELCWAEELPEPGESEGYITGILRLATIEEVESEEEEEPALTIPQPQPYSGSQWVMIFVSNVYCAGSLVIERQVAWAVG